MARVVSEINAASGRPAPSFAMPQNLENVTRELGGLLTASAEAMLTEAQNLLEQTKLWIENLNNEIADKVREHQQLTDKIQTFGKAVLDAHNKYQDK